MKLRNKVGQTPLHCAALAGCWASAALLYNAAPEVALWRDRRDLTAAACAARRGHVVSGTFTDSLGRDTVVTCVYNREL